ncbi:MAG: hypothetical protein BWY82_00381 [Verrucomicrobia bacterium ADurb.Bin474]|nr:MAG: hypothetical protein BWY82_00381 [Verrucomicrobia bacterium ADurb.Bin474]
MLMRLASSICLRTASKSLRQRSNASEKREKQRDSVSRVKWASYHGAESGRSTDLTLAKTRSACERVVSTISGRFMMSANSFRTGLKLDEVSSTEAIPEGSSQRVLASQRALR